MEFHGDAPAAYCVELSSRGTPAIGRYGPAAGPPAAGTQCPPSQAGNPDGTYEAIRIPVGLLPPANPAVDAESQKRTATVDPGRVGLSPAPGSMAAPPEIPPVDDHSPAAEARSNTQALMENHPGYTWVAYQVNTGVYDGASSQCHVRVGYDAVKADTSTPIQVCCDPSSAATAPVPLLDLVRSVEASWRPGTVSTAPAGRFVVFVPTCIWMTGGNVPRTPTTYALTVPQPDDAATGRRVFYTYIVTLTPGEFRVDWGDGMIDTVSADAMGAGPPSRPPDDCAVRHTYKQVSGEAHGGPQEGLLVRVSEGVRVSAMLQWNNGLTTGQIGVAVAPQPAPLDVTPDPQPVHRVEQIEPVLQG